MVKILDEIMKELPKEKIVSIEFEAANIVIYTNNKDFLFSGREKIRRIVSKLKKRIELRADTSLLLDEETSKKKITAILKDVKIGEFKFDSARSILILEVNNVGATVGKEGANLKEIQKQTFWTIIVKRIPPLRSKTVDAMRSIEFQESEYRRKFLNKVGKRIYGGWTHSKIKGWARITMLGSGNQIGRSAIYLQTNESRVIAHKVGQIVFVVEHNKTPQTSIKNALSMLDPEMVIGLIINKNRSGSKSSYYGYGTDAE